VSSPGRSGAHRAPPSLAEKVVAVDRTLDRVPHAFGGALALAYWAEPRATIDIDLNVFVSADRADEVLDPLGVLGVDVGGGLSTIERDGQVRVWWDTTPIYLFFAYDRFHAAADAAALEVTVADGVIRVLSADHLAVCKAVFDRPKDWVDVESMLTLGTALDTAEVLRWVGRIAGDDDPRYERIAALLSGRR
jgi:hypothetical protein